MPSEASARAPQYFAAGGCGPASPLAAMLRALPQCLVLATAGRGVPGSPPVACPQQPRVGSCRESALPGSSRLS